MMVIFLIVILLLFVVDVLILFNYLKKIFRFIISLAKFLRVKAWMQPRMEAKRDTYNNLKDFEVIQGSVLHLLIWYKKL